MKSYFRRITTSSLKIMGKNQRPRHNGNLVVGVFYRPSNQGEPIDKAILVQLQETSCSQALVLLGIFNHPDDCQKSSMAICRQSRRLLECMEDNFSSQVIDSPTRRGAILDLLLTNTSELVSDTLIGDSLGCSGHALVEFAVLRDIGQAKSKFRTLDFRKANFQIFKELVSRSFWKTALRDKAAEQSWLFFKDTFHRA